MNVITEVPCDGKRKHYSPYRCEFVPREWAIEFFQQYPKLCKFVFWDCHLNWMKGSKLRGHCNHLALQKKWWRHPLSIKLQEIMQRKLRYEKSTYAAGHIYHRFGHLYRHVNNYEWYYEDPFGSNRTLVFCKDGIEIDRIKDNS